MIRGAGERVSCSQHGPEEGRVKIRSVETFIVDAGWRPWNYVKVTTDEGLVGWGECSDNRNPYGVVGCIKDFEPLLIGQDAGDVERIYWDLQRLARQNLGGVAHRAI